MIQQINMERRDHIITLEDPIEYVIKSKNCHVSQREVFTHTESFTTALRASLREDPDVIMVGEMRDLETISLAITASETGHLVLATLHTSNASRTLDRLLDVFPSDQQEQVRVMVSESLRGVISHQLIPRADDTIWGLVEKGIVSPHEAFMKAIDKNRFKPFLSAEEEALAYAAGSVPDDEKRIPGNFVKPFGAPAVVKRAVR